MSSKLAKTLHTRFIVDIGELCERLGLSRESTNYSEEAARDFPLLLPESVLDRIEKGNPDDPVLRQFLPSRQELVEKEGFVRDPLCENLVDNSSLSPNRSQKENQCLLQKYEGRVLVFSSNACAAHCRFCFRRHARVQPLFPIPTGYIEKSKEADNSRRSPIETYLEHIFHSVRLNPNVNEVVFSGGDPLTLSNNRLKSLLEYIRSLRTVKRVRFHSRVPILVPDRIDEQFPSYGDIAFSGDTFPPILYMVVHVNSPNEINQHVAKALLDIRKRGYVLTSQTTLLKGVNDTTDVLVELFGKLANCGVVPYYLHQLDRVQGAAHFETSVQKGLKLVREISERLPGYAVPKFVREIPGRMSKVNLLAEPDADF